MRTIQVSPMRTANCNTEDSNSLKLGCHRRLWKGLSSFSQTNRKHILQWFLDLEFITLRADSNLIQTLLVPRTFKLSKKSILNALFNVTHIISWTEKTTQNNTIPLQNSQASRCRTTVRHWANTREKEAQIYNTVWSSNCEHTENQLWYLLAHEKRIWTLIAQVLSFYIDYTWSEI